jgi:hypothetical protein
MSPSRSETFSWALARPCDAVLDRFRHRATVFRQTGETYRLKDAN